MELLNIGTLRGTGKTTRIVDAAIQELFTTGSVTVVDHVTLTDDNRKRTLERVCKRLDNEHYGVRYSVRGFKVSLDN